jgi:hypothetical protein
LLSAELTAAAVSDLHNLRTLEPQSRLRDRPADRPRAPVPANAEITTLHVLSAGREIDLIEIARDHTGAKLEGECKSIIKAGFASEPPPELVALLRRCAEIQATKSELESNLTRLQEELAGEQEALRAKRNQLRQELQARRDEERSLPPSAWAVRSALAGELERLERAYAAPEPPSAIAAAVQQEGTRCQSLRAELLEAQRTLAVQLLHIIQDMAKLGKLKSAGTKGMALKLATRQLAAILSDFDSLEVSLSEM